LVAGFPEESTTWAVKLNGAELLGVPMMAPVALFRAKGGGSKPEMIENVYGGTPPVATRLELYGVPTCPEPAAHVKVKVGVTPKVPDTSPISPRLRSNVPDPITMTSVNDPTDKTRLRLLEVRLKLGDVS
jgi:hypothetical protein